jgi:hypothetical protein
MVAAHVCGSQAASPMTFKLLASSVHVFARGGRTSERMLVVRVPMLSGCLVESVRLRKAGMNCLWVRLIDHLWMLAEVAAGADE